MYPEELRKLPGSSSSSPLVSSLSFCVAFVSRLSASFCRRCCCSLLAIVLSFFCSSLLSLLLLLLLLLLCWCLFLSVLEFCFDFFPVWNAQLVDSSGRRRGSDFSRTEECTHVSRRQVVKSEVSERRRGRGRGRCDFFSVFVCGLWILFCGSI